MAVIGPILGAFGKTKTVQQQYNEGVGKAITGAASAAQSNRALSDADLARYATASQQAAGRVEGLLGQDNATLGALIARAGNYDPMAAYRGIGDYQTGVLDRVSRSLANQGRASQNLNAARLGYGGRQSSYTQNALVDRLSQNLAPAYASVLSNIGRDTQVLSGQGIANMANAANLISQRQNAQGAAANYYLNPALARSQLSMEEAQNLGLLGQAAKGNTAGFRQEKDFVGRLAEGIGEAEGTILDTAMGVLSMYSGGGMGGLMGGGGGGSPGAKSAQRQVAPTFTPTYSPPVDFGSSGGYAQGGLKWPSSTPSYGPMAGGYQYGPAPKIDYYSPQLQAMFGYRPGL